MKRAVLILFGMLSMPAAGAADTAAESVSGEFSFQLRLRQGLNLAYLPLDDPRAVTFGGLRELLGADAVERIVVLNANGRFGAGRPDADFDAARGFIAVMREARAALIRGPAHPPALRLRAGWNLVGSPRRSWQTRLASDVAGLSDAVDALLYAAPAGGIAVYQRVSSSDEAQDAPLYGGAGYLALANRDAEIRFQGEPWGVPAAPEPSAAIPAFPGAEGWGARTAGGRGGEIRYVDSLAESGPGTLRAALEASGPRVVLFRTGGVIRLREPIRIREPNCTVAGQTAPGGGVCVVGAPIQIQTRDVILRGLRIRPGADPGGHDPFERDALNIGQENDTAESLNVRDIIIDRCSFSWSVDELVGIRSPARRVTIQECVLSEALDDSIHPSGRHSRGILIGYSSREISVLRNLIASNDKRNPVVAGGASAEIVHNVVLNWGAFGTRLADVWRSEATAADIVRNTYLAGEDSRGYALFISPEIHAESRVYLEGNRFLSGGNAIRTAAPTRFLAAGPLRTGADWGLSAEEAARSVLERAGATAPKRDRIDERIAQAARNRLFGSNGTTNGAAARTRILDSPEQVGGLPAYEAGQPPLDSDGDHLPDEWERQNGFSPDRRDDPNGDHDRDGYTNIEEYVNSLL